MAATYLEPEELYYIDDLHLEWQSGRGSTQNLPLTQG